MVNVCGIGESFEQLCVTSGPTAILGRARVLAVEAHRVLQTMREPDVFLDDDFVVPRVTEVVFVGEASASAFAPPKRWCLSALTAQARGTWTRR